MLTLADSAKTGTAEIPTRFTPSLRVLAEETGLDRSTVKRHLSALEKAGWVVRSRPDVAAQRNGERTRYRLDLPRGVERPDVGAEEAELGVQDTQGGRTEHPGVGAQNNMGGRTVRHQESDHSDQSQIDVRSAEQARPALSITQRSKGITDAYAAAEPMCKWPAVNAIVIRAIKSEKFSDDEIRDALLRLAKEGRGVTVESLRVELAGLPPGNALVRYGANGGQPYVGTSDRKVAQVDVAIDRVRARMQNGDGQ